MQLVLLFVLVTKINVMAHGSLLAQLFLKVTAQEVMKEEEAQVAVMVVITLVQIQNPDTHMLIL
ncbi:hypothetical protein SME10J_17500 [Serratia marcescens]|nr:hypothetical protein SME10J_17420 [Serratia marcescens]BEM38023.1 hypothetical protein SME10J_17500 [Serratia marcescens]